MNDVRRAMNSILRFNKKVVLMQCNTNYTASIENFKYINLNVLNLYKDMYPDVILGLSDHTVGHSTVLGAIALGARVIEKHFTDDNNRDGPDHHFAMNPKTWSEMVNSSYELFYSLGNGIKNIEKNEISTSSIRKFEFKKSFDKNHVISEEDYFLQGQFQKWYTTIFVKDLIGKKLNSIVEKDTEAEFKFFNND